MWSNLPLLILYKHLVTMTTVKEVLLEASTTDNFNRDRVLNMCWQEMFEILRSKDVFEFIKNTGNKQNLNNYIKKESM